MKRFLPTLLLLLPLHAAVAQYHPSYSPPIRTFTPTPYQTQQRTQQYAHETFQRMQSQQMQQMQMQQMQRMQLLTMSRIPLRVSRQPLSPEQLAQVQTRQQQAEQKATAQLTQLTQQQQQRQQEHPTTDPQQAAAQQQADAQQLSVLTVKTYREVFLPNQLFAVVQSLTLPFQAQQDWNALNGELLSSSWWNQQAAQAPASVAAHSATLLKLTTNLLGFDPTAAATPAAPAASSTPDAVQQLLAQPSFDRSAAAQLLQAAAQADKREAGARLAQAVQEFHTLATSLSGTPAPTKQQRDQVKKSLRHVNQELARYQAHVADVSNLNQARKAILTATADYLAKNSSKG